MEGTIFWEELDENGLMKEEALRTDILLLVNNERNLDSRVII